MNHTNTIFCINKVIFIFKASVATAFCIPADFDDTVVNMGLGALLKQYARWKAVNPSISEVIPCLKKYAYRPFSTNEDSNIIDPRTYFYARDFLHEHTGPLALIPTWVQNLTENRRFFDKRYRMPLNSNNIDLTVSSNMIYGLTAAVLGRNRELV